MSDQKCQYHFYLAVVRDIDERKKSEEKLRESEKRLGEAQRIGRMGNWDWSIETNE